MNPISPVPLVLAAGRTREEFSEVGFGSHSVIAPLAHGQRLLRTDEVPQDSSRYSQSINKKLTREQARVNADGANQLVEIARSRTLVQCCFRSLQPILQF